MEENIDPAERAGKLLEDEELEGGDDPSEGSSDDEKKKIVISKEAIGSDGLHPDPRMSLDDAMQVKFLF